MTIKSNIVSGRQLRAARVLTGLTQKQLSTKAGFAARACRYWESRGDQLPTSIPQSLESIEAVLRLTALGFFLLRRRAVGSPQANRPWWHIS
jgi:transcriptional regulator with XRE-family HTH domain